ncbi:17S U2 SnRNP complex component HTATSF1-like [Amphiura filiformis]|uniref:17S U2 SnRNP complex component HTATSF1-like n=1 Tax=Amphiura filiformis TaxID=82378 RepID=UPI003B2278FD
MDGQEEFEHQLALENEEARKQEQGYIYTDPNDGTVYEWDDEKQAWFPRVDEDFLAAYHANYGIHPTQTDSTASTTSTTSTIISTTSAPKEDNAAPQFKLPQGRPARQSSSSSSMSVEESLMRAQREAEQGIPAVLDEKIAAQDAEHAKGGKRKKEEPTWFDMEESKNTNVYVCGLPTENFTEKDFVELMSKCGIISMDEEKNEPKVKLYRDVEGNLKGDGRCCYLKGESVLLAIQLLDDSKLEGKKIHVQRAQFTMKGNFNPDLKKKKKKPNKKKKVQKNPQDKLLDWRPEKSFQKKRFEQVVIIKHVFHPSEFEEDAMLINEIKDDLQAECSKYGDVKKVMIFDNHPDGVASVKYKDGDSADVCVLALNGRWFAQRQLVAEIWDGKTDYKVEETDKERDVRLKKWEEFLKEDDADKKKTESTPTGESASGSDAPKEDSGEGVAMETAVEEGESSKRETDKTGSTEEDGQVEKVSTGEQNDNERTDSSKTENTDGGGDAEAVTGQDSNS